MDIKEKHRPIIPFKYDSASDFELGLAIVKFEGKYGVIEKTGGEVISFKYDHIDLGVHFRGFITAKKKGRWGYRDRENKER